MSQHLRLFVPPLPNQREGNDSLGFGKLVEGQLGPVLKIIRDRNLLAEPPPVEFKGKRGIVISAGGKYLDYGWVNAKWLRTVIKTDLPIQIWHLGKLEMPEKVKPRFAALDIELVDSFQVRNTHWHRKLGGWQNKLYSATRAPFEQVVFYDADSFAAAPPEQVFDSPTFAQTGAIFWKDVNKCRLSNWLWVFAGITPPVTEMDSGTFFINRADPAIWRSLLLANWLNEHSDITYKLAYGDKDMADVAFRFLRTPFHLAESTWDGYGINHHLNGNLVSRHQMAAKRQEHAFHDPLLARLFEEWRSLK